MKCPVDGAALVMTERTGIEIDYCPTCRGVWLDRGELDKILERSATNLPEREDYSPGRRGHDGHGQGGHDRPGGRRRGGWLGELFD